MADLQYHFSLWRFRMEHEGNDEEHQTAFIPAFLTINLRDTVMADWFWEKRNMISISHKVAAMRKVKIACQRYNAYLLLICGARSQRVLRHESKLDILDMKSHNTPYFQSWSKYPPSKATLLKSCLVNMVVVGFSTKSFKRFTAGAIWNWTRNVCDCFGYHLAKRGYLGKFSNKLWTWQIKLERRARRQALADKWQK